MTEQPSSARPAPRADAGTGTVSEAAPAEPLPRSPRAPRRRRRLLVAALCVACLLGLALYVLTRPPVLAWIVAFGIERAVGGRVTIAAVERLGGGEFRLRQLIVSAPGWEGDAAQVATIEEVLVLVDPARLWRGDVDVRQATLSGATFRLADRADDPTSLNLLALRTPPERRSDGDGLPTIILDRAAYEVGTVLPDGHYLPSGRTHFTGKFVPDPGEEGWYLIDLDEVGNDGRPGPRYGLHLTGRLNQRTLEQEFRLGPLRLNPRIRSLCPLLARLWWDRMDLDGEIAGATLRLRSDAPLLAEIDIRRMEMTAPVDLGPRWVRLREGYMEPAEGRPRLLVRRGILRLDGEALTLEKLAGDVVGADTGIPLVRVPFRLDLTVPQLPPFSWEDRQRWMDTAFAAAPFSLDFELLDFSLATRSDGRSNAVELPLPLADLVDDFRLTSWTINTQIEVRRAAPRVAADGRLLPAPVDFSGQVFLDNASMRYEKFPYPLTRVRGYLRFTQHEVLVEQLRGRGAGGAEVSVAGRIAPPGPGASIDLRIIGSRVPVDDPLIEALPDGAQRVAEALLHRPSWDALARAGLLVDEATLERLREERQTLLAQPPPEAAAEAATREARLATLTRLIDRGADVFGGAIDIDFRVTRPAGIGLPTELNGSVDLAGIGGVFSQFPYPYRIAQGRIEVTPDRVALAGAGIELITGGGGRGRVTGAIETPRIDGRRRFQPDIHLVVADDSVNPLLLAAIPPEGGPRAREGWPGERRAEAARLLAAAGVEATISASADIDADPSGALDWRVVVSFDDGFATPTHELNEELSDEGLHWPHDLALHDLNGVLRITPRRITVERIEAFHRDSAIRGKGAVDLADAAGRFDFSVDAEGLALSPWMADLTPQPLRRRVRDLWDGWRPEGALDVALAGSVRGGEPAQLSVKVTPRALRATIDGRQVTLEPTGGDLSYDGLGLDLNELGFSVRNGDRHDGEIRACGRLSTAPGERGWLDGEWRSAHFQCPLVEEALGIFAGPGTTAAIAAMRPAGTFDLAFRADSTGEAALDRWLLKVEPRELSVLLQETEVAAAFQPGAELIVEPDRALLRQLDGHHGAGDFALDGTIEFGEAPEADLELGASSDGLTPALLALLPAVAHEALDAIELKVDGRLRVEGRLRLRQEAAGGADGDRPWSGAFDGTLDLDDASFRAVAPFEGIDGVLRLHASRSASGAPALRLDVQLDEMQVSGRRLESATGLLRLSPDGGTLLLDSLTGFMYGGMAEARGSVGLSENGSYVLQVEMAGVELAGLAGSGPAEAGPPEDAAPTPLPPGIVANVTTAASSRLPGRVEARVGLAGQRNSAASRRGRGAVRVRDARMAEMPLTLGVLQLSQLMLPLSASLPEADASFFVLGDLVTFERLSLECDTLRLVGAGTMDLPSTDLTARFFTRGTLPVFSDIMRSLSDNLYVIEVSGPLASPRARLSPLPALGAVMLPLLSPEEVAGQPEAPVLRDLPAPLAPERNR